MISMEAFCFYIDFVSFSFNSKVLQINIKTNKNWIESEKKVNLSSKYTGSSSEIYSIGIFTSLVHLQEKQLAEGFDRIVYVVMLLLSGNVNIGWLLLLTYSLKSDCWRWEKTGKNNCCVENWGCLTLQTSHRPHQ